MNAANRQALTLLPISGYEWLSTAIAGDLNEPEGRAEETNAASNAQLLSFLEAWGMEPMPFGDFYSASFSVQLVDGLESKEEFGVLGSQALVVSNTSAPTSSFINRGEFITERLLCAHLPEDLPDAVLEQDTRTPLEVFEVHSTSVSDPTDLSAKMAASSQAPLCKARLWYRQAIRRDLLGNNADAEQVEEFWEPGPMVETSARAPF